MRIERTYLRFSIIARRARFSISTVLTRAVSAVTSARSSPSSVCIVATAFGIGASSDILIVTVDCLDAIVRAFQVEKKEGQISRKDNGLKVPTLK
jgi:hypothetical protein